jgi:hypothetical protein
MFFYTYPTHYVNNCFNIIIYFGGKEGSVKKKYIYNYITHINVLKHENVIVYIIYLQ